jgi:hypothetical protein
VTTSKTGLFLIATGSVYILFDKQLSDFRRAWRVKHGLPANARWYFRATGLVIIYSGIRASATISLPFIEFPLIGFINLAFLWPRLRRRTHTRRRQPCSQTWEVDQ